MTPVNSNVTGVVSLAASGNTGVRMVYKLTNLGPYQFFSIVARQWGDIGSSDGSLLGKRVCANLELHPCTKRFRCTMS
jgi:hypothetical protein